MTAWLIGVVLATGFGMQSTPEESFKAIQAEIRQNQEEIGKQIQVAKTDADKQKLYEELLRQPLKYTKKIVELAEKAPTAPFVLDAAALVIDSTPDAPEASKMIRVLLAQHLDNPRITGIFDLLITQGSPLGEQLFRGIMTGSKKRELQGEATVALGQFMKARMDSVNKAEDKENYQKEAEKYLDTAIRDFKDIPEVAKKADDELYEIRTLAVGKEAPEITGEDSSGKKLKLSDYRGKVVVLDFWAEWCHACMAMVPQEREMATRLAGKPFAIVGVNLDDSRELQKKCEQKHQISWRSISDGREGPIATQWKIRALPTIYVLDAKGIIRYKGVQDKELEEAVSALLRSTK